MSVARISSRPVKPYAIQTKPSTEHNLSAPIVRKNLALIEALSMPPGVEYCELEIPKRTELGRAADFS